MIDGLQRQGIAVVIRDQTTRARMMSRIWHILRASMTLKNVDAVIIPAFNQVTAPFTWAIQRVLGRRVVCDYLVGLKDTQIDRSSIPISPLKRKIFVWLENIILTKLITLTDTTEHIAYFSQIHAIQPYAMYALPVGTRQVFLDSPPPPTETPNRPLIVQYLGSYIPFHGVEIILHAAAALENEAEIQFELIGSGQTLQEMRELAEQLKLQNTSFVAQYVKPPALFQHLKRASIFLGVFGSSPKTSYVVSTKIFELMGLKRPLITADSASIRSHFQPGAHLLTVPPGDPLALADAIRELAASPELRKRLAEQAHAHLQRNYTPEKIGEKLLYILERRRDHHH